jgi:hypothetical protein
VDSRYAVRQLPTCELTRCRGYPPFGGYRTAALPLAARFINSLTWQTGGRGTRRRPQAATTGGCKPRGAGGQSPAVLGGRRPARERGGLMRPPLGDYLYSSSSW